MSDLKNFKFGHDNSDHKILFNTLNNLTFFAGVRFNNTEWVYQFDDNEPIVFAVENNGIDPTLTLRLDNTNNAHITFIDEVNNKQFKIYARERQ
jgi:hypothetical protein